LIMQLRSRILYFHYLLSKVALINETLIFLYTTTCTALKGASNIPNGSRHVNLNSFTGLMETARIGLVQLAPAPCLYL
jgi:hypothetical protein